MNDFYFSSAGYIIDTRITDTSNWRIGRLKDKPNWREAGRALCIELCANSENVTEILKKFSKDLE